MSEVYNDYIQNENNNIEFKGERYHKVICKELAFGFSLLTLPQIVFVTSSNILQDNRGKVFQVGAPCHYSFRGEIPEWYLKTVQVPLLEDIDIKEIGNYVRQV